MGVGRSTKGHVQRAVELALVERDTIGSVDILLYPGDCRTQLWNWLHCARVEGIFLVALPLSSFPAIWGRMTK
jgi:hypothetical protein